MSSSPRISIDAVFAYPYECILTIRMDIQCTRHPGSDAFRVRSRGSERSVECFSQSTPAKK